MTHEWYEAPSRPPRVSPVSERPKSRMIYEGNPPLWLRLGRFCQRCGWKGWAKRLMGQWSWNQEKGHWENPNQRFDIVDVHVQYRQMQKKMDL